MKPYAPGPLAANAVDAGRLAAYTLTELKKIAELTRTAERELVGSVTVRSPGTADYRVLPSDALVRVDALFAPVTVTLPVASVVVGNRFTVKRLNSAGSAVTVAANGSDLIDGVSTKTLTTQYERITVVAVRDGTSTSWDVL